MDVRVESRTPVQDPGARKTAIHSRSLDRTLNVRDVRAEVARASQPRPNEREEVRAFLESRRRIVRSHPHLTAAERAQALQEPRPDRSERRERVARGFRRRFGRRRRRRRASITGRGRFWCVLPPRLQDRVRHRHRSRVCRPLPAGGNVHSRLYLAATNRAARGPQAVAVYHGQDEFVFAVFDWARPEGWQVAFPSSQLDEYLGETELDGSTYRALRVLTFAEEAREAGWRNEVYLHHPTFETFDLVYAFEYEATLLDQQAGWEGSWGPIIVTFQNRIHGTGELGFSDFSVASRRGDAWDSWEALSPADTYVAQDETGFRITYLEPNHTFLAAA